MMDEASDFVELVEVGPRDGLQNEPGPIATADKVELIDCLSAAGFHRIEVASFVSPRWVPQMADSAEVLAGINRRPGVSYAALVPNLTGLDRAIAARADEIAVFVSASEGFSRANLNCSVAESLERIAPVVGAARTAGLRVRGYVSCVTDCPFDGPVSPDRVAEVAQHLAGLGIAEVSLGDTIGRATPDTTDAMLSAVLNVLPADRLAGHFHDTGGRALENLSLALERGLRIFDVAVGGLGGCPFAPGAPGNVATEAVAQFLTERGFRTGLDPKVLHRAVDLAQNLRRKAREGETL